MQGIAPEDVQQMDSVNHIEELQAVGVKRVKTEHFAVFLG